MPPKDGMPKGKRPVAVPRPSASVVLVSPQNHILLLQRVRESSTFASAHVFPGGNVSELHDHVGINTMPAPETAERHRDSEIYRMAAVRETFEESGILLAKTEGGRLMEVEESEREKGRQDVHSNKVKFGDWVQERSGKVDTAGLIPFTRWVTPITMPKRFTTQMYIYFLPTSSSTPLSGASQASSGNDEDLEPEIKIPNPTPDGGKEHTTARFLPASAWLRLAQEGRIILFPPQFFLLHQVAQHFDQLKSPTDYASISRETLSRDELERRRESLRKFLQTGDPPWTEMCMSPTPQRKKRDDGRAVLALDWPGPEVEKAGGNRRGIKEQCVLVDFQKQGPRRVAVVNREDVLGELEAKL